MLCIYPKVHCKHMLPVNNKLENEIFTISTQFEATALHYHELTHLKTLYIRIEGNIKPKNSNSISRFLSAVLLLMECEAPRTLNWKFYRI